MTRTLTGRGLVLVSVCLVAAGLSATPAFASNGHSGHRHRHVVVTGDWTDPGPTIDKATPAGAQVIVDMHGETHTTGGFAGASTYKLRVLFDPATNVSDGHARETFLATLGRRGSGHVTFWEHVKVETDGSEVVTGRIVAGDGVFRGAHGFIRYVGSTDPTGANPATGTYRFAIDLGRSHGGPPWRRP